MEKLLGLNETGCFEPPEDDPPYVEPLQAQCIL